MKQTAVEWLVAKLKESGIPLLKDELEFIEQAKEMEKQQIIDAYDKGEFNQGCNEDAAQYYNETFQ